MSLYYDLPQSNSAVLKLVGLKTSYTVVKFRIVKCFKYMCREYVIYFYFVLPFGFLLLKVSFMLNIS